MITIGSKRLMTLFVGAVAALSAVVAIAAPTGQFHVKTFDSFDVLACTDMTAVPEAMDYMRHDPNNPALLGLMQDGGCSPMSPEVNFSIIKKYTWQIPAGAQDLVQIAIPVAENPKMQPLTSWVMASDVEPSN